MHAAVKKKSAGGILFFALIIPLFLSLCSCSPKIQSEYDIEAAFSPDRHIDNKIIERLKSASKSIDIAMYSFTKRDIAWEVVNARKRGVRIRVVMDGGQSSNKYSKLRFFAGKGIETRLHYPTMHNKFAVIDGSTVITGSYNWTANAENVNRENILFIDGNSNLADKFETEFEDIWRKSEPVSGR